jgi:hypothetical protein
MLMNLMVWRHEGLATTAMAFAKKHNPRWIDQSGINVACAGKIAYLPEQWNFQLHKIRRPGQWLEPNIIHYVGPKKPWIYSDVPFASIYLHHRNQTPFAIERLAPLIRRYRRTAKIDSQGGANIALLREKAAEGRHVLGVGHGNAPSTALVYRNNKSPGK